MKRYITNCDCEFGIVLYKCLLVPAISHGHESHQPSNDVRKISLFEMPEWIKFCYCLPWLRVHDVHCVFHINSNQKQRRQEMSVTCLHTYVSSASAVPLFRCSIINFIHFAWLRHVFAETITDGRENISISIINRNATSALYIHHISFNPHDDCMHIQRPTILKTPHIEICSLFLDGVNW